MASVGAHAARAPSPVAVATTRIRRRKGGDADVGARRVGKDRIGLGEIQKQRFGVYIGRLANFDEKQGEPYGYRRDVGKISEANQQNQNRLLKTVW